MVPRWDAPEGISPALVNYIDRKGFSDGGWTAFSATALKVADGVEKEFLHSDEL